jgi:hypothetical protein
MHLFNSPSSSLSFARRTEVMSYWFGGFVLCSALAAGVGRYPLVAFGHVERFHAFPSTSHFIFREIFQVWITPFSISAMRRVYLLWYVCSRGPFPLFLPGTPCSSIFPSAAYRHRAVPASPWLARLAATRTADAAAVKDAGGWSTVPCRYRAYWICIALFRLSSPTFC